MTSHIEMFQALFGAADKFSRKIAVAAPNCPGDACKVRQMRLPGTGLMGPDEITSKCVGFLGENFEQV